MWKGKTANLNELPVSGICPKIKEIYPANEQTTDHYAVTLIQQLQQQLPIIVQFVIEEYIRILIRTPHEGIPDSSD